MQQASMRPARGIARRWVAVLGSLAIVSSIVLSGQLTAAPAHAAELPTWSDVQKAKKNQAATAAKVKEIKQLLAQSQAELVRLQQISADATAKAKAAEQAYQLAAEKSQKLDERAAASRAEAEEASRQAATLVSQLYRSGGVDRSLELFLQSDGDTADVLLDRMAAISKVTERNSDISAKAQLAMNTAQSLGDQAEAARVERQALQEEAQKQQKIAADAAAAQVSRINAQQDQQDQLKAQLEALEDKTAKTVKGYEERLRKEKEEREKAEQGGGTVGGGLAPGGWRVPIPYRYISTYFNTTSAFGTWHTGIDLVNGCGTPIAAAKSGTVYFVGWMDNMGGNMVYLNHGGGYQTRYAHLSRFAVSNGQHVNQGQVIGYVGTTGASTGCHLHYEVLINNVFQNPIKYI